MMAAMMLPSLVPTVLLFGTVTKSRTAVGFPAVPSLVFVAGYFLAWAALGALVGAGAHFVPMDVQLRRYAAAGALFVGGIYQLTALKARCLDHCRSPMHFFMGAWRDGPLGALRLGAHHGLYCVACCWGLMASLIALGMMRPLWMVAIGVIIFVEKTIPGGQKLAPFFGVALLFVALVVLTGYMGDTGYTGDMGDMGGMHG